MQEPFKLKNNNFNEFYDDITSININWEPFKASKQYNPEIEEIIRLFLVKDQKERINNFQTIKSHSFFKDIAWNKLTAISTGLKPYVKKLLVKEEEEEKLRIKNLEKLELVEKLNKIEKTELKDDNKNIYNIDNIDFYNESNTRQDLPKDDKTIEIEDNSKKSQTSIKLSSNNSLISIGSPKQNSTFIIRKSEKKLTSSSLFVLSRPEIIQTLNNAIIKQDMKKVNVEIIDNAETSDPFLNLNI